MTIKETAKMLNVSESYVYKLIKDGKLKPKPKKRPTEIDNLSAIEYIQNRKPRGRPPKYDI